MQSGQPPKTIGRYFRPLYQFACSPAATFRQATTVYMELSKRTVAKNRLCGVDSFFKQAFGDKNIPTEIMNAFLVEFFQAAYDDVSTEYLAFTFDLPSYKDEKVF